MGYYFLDIQYLFKMEAKNMLPTYDVKLVISEKKLGFDDTFNVTKCHQQSEIPDLLHMCE